MLVTSFLSAEEIEQMGFKKVGLNPRISRKASFYHADLISIGDHCRVDDFCILSGTVTLGNYVHIAAGGYLYGENGIVLGDFSGTSSHVAIYSGNDDFHGNALISTTVGDEFSVQVKGKITIGRHVIVGSGCVLLPGSELPDGCCLGALTLVTGKKLEPWTIYGGVPARFIKARKSDLIPELEKKFLGK